MSEPGIAPFTLCEAIQLRGSQSVWVAVIGDPSLPSGFIADLQADCEAMLAQPLPVMDVGATRPDALRQRLGGIQFGGLFIGLELWSDAHWRALDLNRSVLEGRGPIILIVDVAAAARLADLAPNVRSLIGGSIFQPAPDVVGLSPEEKKLRIEELRNHFGWSDEEMIAKRKSENLALDAHMAEWLVLLGQSDLL